MGTKQTGAFIAERRKALHMTQKELASQLHVTDKAVSKWERGIGYPEITTVPLLAKLLGVSTSEIIAGEHAESPLDSNDRQETAQSDAIVLNTAEYVQHLQKQKTTNVKDIAFLCLSGALLAGIFICGLCNYVVSAKFDWSLYVFGSAALVWLVALPLLKSKNHSGLFSLAGLSIAIVPFLLLIEYVGPIKNWVVPFALPIVAISLVSLWVFALLLVFAKLKYTSQIAWAAILFGIVDNLLIQRFVEDSLHLSSFAQNGLASGIVAIICACIAVCLFAATAFSRKRSR